ncbi:hypothetical protein GCM10023330_16250 [Litoribaculum gwangyangense]|uniref:Uncharacterized protein n=2 Tax=Litoribaculum gwangyangense TaxID=1130722 RepID=A0ABP9CKI6_9FLAO
MLQGLFKADLETDDAQVFRIRLNILLMKFYIYPLKRRKRGVRKIQEKFKKKYQTEFKKKPKLMKIFRVLRTFKVKQVYVNMDTGNYILNAKLYPIFSLLNYKFGNFHVNFLGQNELVLLIKNRPINIIKAFINF